MAFSHSSSKGFKKQELHYMDANIYEIIHIKKEQGRKKKEETGRKKKKKTNAYNIHFHWKMILNTEKKLTFIPSFCEAM